MVQIPEWQNREEVPHAAQPVLMERDTSNGGVTSLQQRKLYVSVADLQGELRVAAPILAEDVFKVGSAFSTGHRVLLEMLELRHSTSDSQIGSSLAPVAGGMAQSEVVLLIRSTRNEWDDVVKIELSLMQHEIDWLIANEALARLTID
jgi:hypothetical protein